MLPEYLSPNFPDTGMCVALSIVGELAKELCITCGDAILHLSKYCKANQEDLETQEFPGVGQACLANF